MSKPMIRASEIFSLAVMLLMFVALAAGQADTTGRAAAHTTQIESAIVFSEGKR